MTNGVICLEDRERAREIAKAQGRGYLVTMVNLYHDTMPKSPDGITWPHAPASTLIEWTDEMLDQIIEAGYMLCGNPEEVSEQLEAYQSVGCDQVVFGLPIEGMQHEEIKEMLSYLGFSSLDEFINEVIPNNILSDFPLYFGLKEFTSFFSLSILYSPVKDSVVILSR